MVSFLKRLLFCLLMPAAALAQTASESSAINQKIDLSTRALPAATGLTFWIGNNAYHNGQIERASADGTRVSIATSEGPLDVVWATMSAETKRRFHVQYRAAVAAANAEAERALAEQKAASEAVSGVQTYRAAKVVQVLEDGLVLIPAESEARFFLKGHPDQAKLADDDLISFKAREDGLYKNGGSTLHSFQYLGPAEP